MEKIKMENIKMEKVHKKYKKEIKNGHQKWL
jgi:hypothetical protein